MLCPNLRLELPNCPEHVEQQASGCIAGIDVLIEHLQFNLLPL